jgi:hypothetical protein
MEAEAGAGDGLGGESGDGAREGGVTADN